MWVYPPATGRFRDSLPPETICQRPPLTGVRQFAALVRLSEYRVVVLAPCSGAISGNSRVKCGLLENKSPAAQRNVRTWFDFVASRSVMPDHSNGSRDGRRGRTLGLAVAAALRARSLRRSGRGRRIDRHHLTGGVDNWFPGGDYRGTFRWPEGKPTLSKQRPQASA